MLHRRDLLCCDQRDALSRLTLLRSVSLFLVLLGPAVVAATETLDVTVRLPGKAPAAEAPVQLKATASGESAKPVLKVVRASERSSIELDRSLVWEVSAEAEGYWVAKALVAPQDGPLTLHLWPAGSISGTVEPPRGEKSPSEITVRFQSSPEAGKRPQFGEETLTCPVKDGAWSCRVPAGKLDLRLRAKGFVSHFRWGIAVPGGKDLNLGGLPLQRGASVAGRVETAEGALDTKSCKIRLRPFSAGLASSLQDQERQDQLSFTAEADVRGFFHFEGVKPGSYILTAEQPGFAPASIYPVSVLDGSESEVRQPLLLQKALTLEVRVEPALDPWNQPWSVLVEGTSAVPFSTQRLGKADPAEGGRHLKKGLAPGDYRIEVQDSRGSAFQSAELALSPGSPPLEIRLPVAWVEGSVRLGGEPVAANLWFGGQHGQERILMRAGEDGTFEGALPRAGEWEVDIDGASPPIQRRVRGIRVQPAEGGEAANVTIDLPDTRISGEVVDDKGAPATRARIMALELETGRPTILNTDENGKFELNGVPEGPLTLVAETADARSDEVLVNVSEDNAPDSLRLTLKKLREVTGMVLSASGGVPGAQVIAFARNRQNPALLPRGIQSVTGVDGGFSLKIPAGTTDFKLIVLPPGFSMVLQRIEGLPEEPLRVAVSGLGGTIRLKPLPEGDLSDPATERLNLWLNGASVDSNVLRAWAAINGETNSAPAQLLIPSLPPGTYTACWSSLAEAVSALQTATPAGRCTTGALAAGSELVLERPAEP